MGTEIVPTFAKERYLFNLPAPSGIAIVLPAGGARFQDGRSRAAAKTDSTLEKEYPIDTEDSPYPVQPTALLLFARQAVRVGRIREKKPRNPLRPDMPGVAEMLRIAIVR